MLPRLAAWTAGAVLLGAPPAPAQPKPDAPLRRALDGLTARSIGPANMGGRVTDLAVVEADPRTFYVAAASGGVWKTTDGGHAFSPVFDDQPTLSIGAVAVCQGKPDVVYVGTGEANPRNSVDPGAGVFRSADGGKTWAHRGLAGTHHIGRIVVHPTYPDVAYVAALGHAWGPNRDRGLYKTTDGGKTWTNTKFIDESTGFVDVAMDPADPDTLYAAAWTVRRDAFAGSNPFIQTGPAGGLFKTTDAGKTWAKLGGGLPDRPVGRCGISIYRKDPRILLAVVQTDRTNISPLGQPPKPGDDASTGGVFRSEDRGKTWKKLNDLVPRPFYYGKLRIDPTTDRRVYVLGVSLFVSTDGGATFATQRPAGVHPDHHALWIDPEDPEHLILGNDGGLFVSTDRGKTFEPRRGLVVAQFYGVAADARTPYRVFGGLQDNGSWGGPVATPYPDGVTLADWFRVAGADGFQCAVDPADPDTVYAEGQHGGLVRITLHGDEKPTLKPVRPPLPKGEPPHRFNWNAPLAISPHDPRTLYFGGEVVFKSTNRGDTWAKISPDLTRLPKGAPAFTAGHTISALAVSPVQAGVLWAGTDDGKVWVTRDGGKTWGDVGRAVPTGSPARWVSKVECSRFAAGAAYLAVERHRHDDFAPYLYRTTDFGATWKPITSGLPPGAFVRVVRQSSKNGDVLFAGTELGLYVTLDRGVSWHHLNRTGLPAHVRIDDLLIHPRERELVIGTHGRGVWVMDVAPLEQLTEAVLAADAHLFDVKPVTLLKPRERRAEPPPGFVAKNPPRGIGVTVLTAKAGGQVMVHVKPPGGEGDVWFWYLAENFPAGLHTHTFDVKKPGEYTVTLTVGDKDVATKRVTVKAAE